MFAIILLTLIGLVALASFVVAATTKGEAKAGGIAVGAIALVIFVVVWGFFGHTFIKNQHVGYVKLFGVVQPDTYIEPGFHLKAPWVAVDQVETAVETMTFSGTQGANPLLEGLTSDQVLMHVDLAVSWQPVASNVPAFKRTFGLKADYDTQVYSIIRSAVRDVLASTAWKEGAIQNRAAFAVHIKNAIETKTVEFFKEAGLPEARAKNMVRYGAVNLRQIIPPEQIQQVNNDMAAAEVKEQLQAKLQRVEEKARQTNEARAQNTMALVRVPAGMTPNEYANVLHAMNERMNAETLRDSIAAGKQVNVVVGLGVAPQPVTGVK